MSERPTNRRRGEHQGSFTVSLVIAVLAVGLAYGMNLLGVLAAFEESVLLMLIGLAGQDGFVGVPAAIEWLLLGPVCLGLAYAMIESPGGWRRLVLWITCGGVIAAAIPVAALAARWLAPGGPMVAWVWTGVCGMIYAHRNDPQPVQSGPKPMRVAPAAPPSLSREQDSWNDESGAAGD